MKRGSSLRRTEWPKPRMTGASGMGLTQLLRARLPDAHRGLAAQRRRPVLDGSDDVDVASTATQVARDTAPDLRLGRARIGGQQGLCAEQHAGRAEPALQAVLLEEALLQSVQLAVLLQAFDRLDLAAVGLDRQHRARLDRIAVQQNRAGATVRGITPDVGAREVQVLPDEV